jgi:sugar/nucleoside kinase (ribokinase family)
LRPESGAYEFDVVGMGLNAVDHICVIPRFPRYDEKLRMVEFHRTVGGQVASALVACSRWGLKASYIGKVGSDEMGDFSLSNLEKEGLDLSYVKRVEGARNQFAIILVDATTGERTIIWKRDDGIATLPEDVPADGIARGRFLLLDGHDAPAAARAAGIAKEKGVGVVIDAETVKPGTEDMVRASDHVVCSSRFPEAFTGAGDLREALKRIADMGPGCVIATLGREGALCLLDGRFTESRGFKVDCVDSTGAGDVFHGAFVYGLVQDWDIARTLEFSNAAAALNCTAIGARGGIATPEAIFNLMETGSRW